MKTRILFLLVVAWSCVCCSKLSDNDDTTGDQTDEKTSKVVKKLVLGEEESIFFDYDSKGRLVGYYHQYETTNYRYTISYENNSIQLVNKDDGYVSGVLFELDKSGYASKMKITSGNEVSLNYKDAYLSSLAYGDEVMDDITYSGGNCLYYSGQYMEYTSHANDYSIDMNNLWVLIPVEAYYFVKLKGITGKNLIGQLNSGGSFRMSFDYTFDEFERVRTITVTRHDGYVSTVTVEYYD